VLADGVSTACLDIELCPHNLTNDGEVEIVGGEVENSEEIVNEVVIEG
jgi:hypothetical protein